MWRFGDGRKLWAVAGRVGGWACVVGLIGGSMTAGKTVLYGEYKCRVWIG